MRLLYLAHSFPPSPAVGAVRAWSTARWLAAAGWSVTVVTPGPELWLNPDEPRDPPPGVSVVPAGHRWPMLMPDYLRWIDGRAGWFLGGVCRVAARKLKVDPGVGWGISAEQACSRFKPGAFDLILATGGPYSTFGAAHRVSGRLDCPFVMDYRDPWTGNPHGNSRRWKGSSDDEAALLLECGGATVVSSSWAKLIGERFGVERKISVVTNGFDPDMFTGLGPRRFDGFSIVYAGTLYPPKRVLDPVLRAFRAFVQGSGMDARFHYFGDFSERVRQTADRLGISREVETHGRVSRKTALEAQKGADLLVVVASVEEESSLSDRGIVTGKVFDCMALERPALVVAPRGSDLYEIAETAGGMRCFVGSQEQAMAAYMADVAAGRRPEWRRPEAYRWDAVGRKLDAALRAALS